MNDVDQIAAAQAKWVKKVADRPMPSAATSSGLPVALAYTPADVADHDYLKDAGMPGDYPFLRGIQPTMYRGRTWTMREYSGLATAEESNARYKFLLNEGQTGLSVAFDLPTQVGYDSDDPRVEEEVGRVGVAVDTVHDMEVLFNGIPLDKVSTSFTINATAAIIMAMYLVVAEKQGVAADKVTGTIQNDILKEYASRGTWIFPPEPSLRLIVDSLAFCSENVPRFNAISIAGAHFRDAGATAIQEMAFTLADAITYVERTVARGLAVDKFAQLLSFFFYTHNDFFEEIAKYRAGRRLWARIMRDRFGAKDPRSLQFRVGVACGGSTLTAEQPMNNIVRVSYQALAAVLGGVQSVFTCAYDEAYAIPTAESAELALRTQQILAFETGVPNVVDPLAGSYFVEALTDRMEREIVQLIERIEAQGGMVEAIQKGFVQREILEEAYRTQRRIDSGEKVVIGVNKYRKAEDHQDIDLYEMNPDTVRLQIEGLRQIRAERDGTRVAATLAALKQAAEGSANLMPYIVDAVRAYASVGEITGVLRQVFGEFHEPMLV